MRRSVNLFFAIAFFVIFPCTEATFNVTFTDTNDVFVARQNPFIQWLGGVIGIRPSRPTTTTKKPLTTKTTTYKPTISHNFCNLKCVCGVPSKKRRIVGGHETQENQYPWVAMLFYNTKFYCGASLINDRYVMTAAHCVSGFNSTFIKVRLLDHDRTNPNPDRIDRKIKRVIQHSGYTGTTYNNDIALLLLDKPIEMSSEMRPVCLPTPRKSFTGEVGIAMGWGAIREHGQTSNTLQEVNVPILSNSECKRSKYGPNRITDNMICAGYQEGEKDSCQGDSGGPMHVNNGVGHEVVGIVSWGEGCAQPSQPGVYTRVNRYLTWIKSNAPDACYCQ